jgi:RHS repeat-associated protein
MIYDGSQLRVWVDGFQSNTVFPAPAGNANTLSIGRTSGNSDWFTGQIDDVSLYTRALTAGEVQNHHTRGLNTPNTTSVYYRFGGSVETADPSTNPSVTDIDTNAPDGTDLAHDTEDPLSLAQATNFLYYNGHGDLAIETDNTGTVTATHSYDPFGAALDTTAGNNTTVAAAGGTERYAASWDKKTDISTSLVQMGARPYDPTTGRFYSTDPVPGGSLNNYDYAGQDPLNGYDLTGLETDGNRNWTDGNEEGGSGETEAQAWARAANEPIVGLGYSVNDALKNPEETIGGTLGSDASKLFEELRMEGWTVGENAEGTGIRAIDGKGRSIILEENVDRAGDKIHPDLPDWYWRVSTGRGPVQRFPRR